MNTVYDQAPLGFKIGPVNAARRNGDPVNDLSSSPPLQTLHPALETVLSYIFDIPDVTRIGCWKSYVPRPIRNLNIPRKPRAFDHHLCPGMVNLNRKPQVKFFLRSGV